MRILVDIVESELKALDKIAKSEKVSRASLIRKAVNDFLDRHDRTKEAEAFGLWGNRKIDGLEYQDKVRNEW
ncbi:ribbon-helix-helix protein, CopG family [Rhizobium mongolense]|uniref:Metal-responsive CopG/Arc/MetJ family transcriptional regulator n=1 Tax=Rhizobium mongolense TaxID=57676 RepID=A0A7W6RL34_9HYPH|nr:ribbon-helix-helix protein, CopG family [Rhizobium mongolense]MBB4274451.1 metal-responsive CopG/Arc/MetJ family transcriptional regulator [Rhizobium mongolense]